MRIGDSAQNGRLWHPPILRGRPDSSRISSRRRAACEPSWLRCMEGGPGAGGSAAWRLPAVFCDPGGSCDVGGIDVGCAPVQRCPGPVVRMVVRGWAWEAASCTSRSGTGASRAAVMNACLSVCGPIFLSRPARRATRRTIRPAACRSSRCMAVVVKVGPSQRSPITRSIARAVRGASGMTAFLPPCG
jgi:hypothetical protein